MKLDKRFWNNIDDIYIAATYIAPENSPFHDLMNVDIFRKLETDIGVYENLGKIFIIGDLNSRTAHKVDYISNDGNIGHDDATKIDDYYHVSHKIQAVTVLEIISLICVNQLSCVL